MQFDLNHHPPLHNGRPAILAGAWVELHADWDLTDAQLVQHGAFLHHAGFDLLVCDWDGDGLAEPFQRLTRLASVMNAGIMAIGAPVPRTRSDVVYLEPPAQQNWASTVGPAETAPLATVALGPLVVAWARQIAHGADHWVTRLFALPPQSPPPETLAAHTRTYRRLDQFAQSPDFTDPLPALALAQAFRRLQQFARKQSELLLASPPVTDASQFVVLAAPPRVELVCRRMPNKPVWTVFVINPTPHPTVGPLQLKLGDREIDCGTVRVKPERFAVFQITEDRRPATNRHRPPAEIARQKGQSKADSTRVNDLLKAGLRIRTLFRGTEI